MRSSFSRVLVCLYVAFHVVVMKWDTGGWLFWDLIVLAVGLFLLTYREGE